MNEFEKMWRDKIVKNTEIYGNDEILKKIIDLNELDEVAYSQILIKTLKENLLNDGIKSIFCKSACHIPHEKLENVRKVYNETKNIEKARIALEKMFIIDIKQHKNLNDKRLKDILVKRWGAAGLNIDGKIIATKIPSKFHEYFAESDNIKKKYYYCHCPRVRKELLNNSDLDSIYCNCGGGFYQDIWEYITGQDVDIKVLKNLFDGDETCQFEITIK